MLTFAKRQSRALIAVLLVLSLGVVALSALRFRAVSMSGSVNQSATGNADQGADDIRQLQAQIDALRQQLNASNATRPATIASEVAPLSFEEARAQATLKNQREIQALDAIYAEAKADPAWAEPAEQRLTRLIGEDIPTVGGIPPLEKSVSCKERFCRISTTFRSGDDTESWVDAFIAGAASDLPRTRIIPRFNLDGTTTFLIYGVSEDKLELLHMGRKSRG